MSKTQTTVTGRDDYIIAKALAWAIAAIPHLPEHHQPQSDRADMLEILRARAADADFPGADFLLAEAAELMSHIEERYRADDYS